ncbi:hypothetical protein [Buchananella hordeovulneris]|uniref:hypothetical protein n=1 Tax=Buchananella hordeovulneris TaxID=52770 RepID=UPI001FED82DF|nr:hypothetical protein [Buchananella hordeovulneris]
MRIRRLGTVAAVLGCVLGLAACGQQADAGSAATAGATSWTDETDLALVQCLRDEGIAISDPQPGGLPVFESDENLDPAAFEAAAKKCGEKLGLPSDSFAPISDQESLDLAVQMAECLRTKGHDVPDPLAGQDLQIAESVPQSDLEACFQQVDSQRPGGEETK